MFVNIKESNFEDLVERYFNSTLAKRAAQKIVESMGNEHDRELRKLLRDYNRKSVYRHREAIFREATDELLTFCGILEIASQASFIVNVRESTLGRYLSFILENVAVRTYYEKSYPTKLPQLLALRLVGKFDLADQSDSATNIMLAFLDQDLRFRKIIERGVLLPLLDSLVIDGVSLDDIISVIGKRELFLQYLLTKPDKDDVRSLAVHELGPFMQFCFDLKELLTEADSNPLLRSAIWHHYGYWFGVVGNNLNNGLIKALEAFLSWKSDRNSEEAATAVKTYVQNARDSLDVLTSSYFMNPVTSVLQEVIASERIATTGEDPLVG